jgi:hypothetical protein
MKDLKDRTASELHDMVEFGAWWRVARYKFGSASCNECNGLGATVHQCPESGASASAKPFRVCTALHQHHAPDGEVQIILH